METLLFKARQGAIVLRPGESKKLGAITVGKFSKIRIVVDSGSRATRFRVYTKRKEVVGGVEYFDLPMHAQATRTYERPGTKITIFADALEDKGTNGDIDLIVYGS
jgi:hypothetical protein